MVERFNCTLKARIWKYFTARNTRVYIDILQDIVQGYNNSYRRSIGRAPASVSLLNVGQVRRKLYGKSWTKPRRKFKFKLGDQVRVSKSRRTFKKGYLPSWTQEIFIVAKIIPRVPPVYRLRDYADDDIEGVFCAEELQKVHKSDDIYKIEKIVAEKKENGKVKVLVKWLGHDKKFNSWIPKSELRKLQIPVFQTMTVLFQSIARKIESEFYVMLPSNSSMQCIADNKTSNFLTKLPRTQQLDGEWEVGLAEIDYPHTWYNIRKGKNSLEIYVPDKWYQDISIQPGYYEKVQDVIDALLKAGLANVTDVVVSYDDNSKRVAVRCAKGTVLELRGDIARMFGYLNYRTIRASDKKISLLPYPDLEINIFTFIPISSRAIIMMMLLFPFFVLLQ